jgi:hypothetical protein
MKAYAIVYEKAFHHTPHALYDIEPRKFAILFSDSGKWQWASAENPLDTSEGWALGGFATSLDLQFMKRHGKAFEWGGV